MTIIKDLETITNNLIKAKDKLDRLEREYALAKANAYVKIMGQFTNAEAREAQTTLVMENDFKSLLDTLQCVRFDARSLSYKREVLIETLKENRMREVKI